MLACGNLFGQEPDTLQISSEDSVKVKKHTPAKAVLLSAVVPGLGQIYNKKLWKAPIIWAGLGTSIYFVIYNSTGYHEYRTSYLVKIGVDTSSDDPYPNSSTEDVLGETETWRKYTELLYITTGAIYLLNLIDASVDAHLFEFDVSDNLSLHIQPRIFHSSMANQTCTGFTLTLKL